VHTSIDCIAIPTTVHELDELALLFATWHLLHQGSRITTRLLLTYPGDPDPLIREKVCQLISLFNIDSLFLETEVEFLCIPKQDDIYIKHGAELTGKTPRLGLKSGPNTQFFKTIARLRSCGYTFLNETDVFPLTPNWLINLSSSLRRGHDWVLGSPYCGNTVLGADIISHINGAAVYATGNSEFQSFYENYWEPGVAHMCKEYPDTAYDIWLSRLQHNFSVKPSLWSSQHPSFQKLFTKAIGKFTSTDQIANLTLPGDYKPVADLIKENYSLIHGKHFRAEALRNALAYADSNNSIPLTKPQVFAILARSSNSAELAIQLEKLLPPSIIHIARKIVNSRLKSSLVHQETKKVDTNPPVYTAIATQSKHIYHNLLRLSRQKVSSLIAFSPYKAGSTLLFTGLKLMQSSDFLNMKYRSYYDEYFALSGSTNSDDAMRDLANRAHEMKLIEASTIYGGFRDCIPFTSEENHGNHIDLFEHLSLCKIPTHFIFLMRDPRDCLVSLYYSHKKSHQITSEESYLVGARTAAEELDINTYAYRNMADVKSNTSRILALVKACQHYQVKYITFAYEDIYTNQHTMFSRIAKIMDKDLTNTMWNELVRRSQVSRTPLGSRPNQENANVHIRKGTPGDHREKLSQHLIEECTKLFSDELALLKQIHPVYSY
jgi:hypothetical protein